LEQQRQKHSTLFALSQESLSPVQRCPKCGSVFITDLECESCGLQFELDRLQDPFGERSYFRIKERVLERSKVFGLYLPWLNHFQKNKARSEYFYRLRALLEDLCLSVDDYTETKIRRFYILELGLLIEELTFSSENEEKTLEDILILLEGPKAQTLSQLIQKTFDQALEKKQNFSKEGLLHKKYFGLIGLSSIVRIMALVAFTVLLGLAGYRYLTLGA
jgi:methionyl-tRNA synthetase